MKHTLSSVLGLITALAAQAHPGHDMPGSSHWHATDVLGYLAVAAVAVGAAWWIRRK
jgi:hypothetical protein